MCTMNLLPLYLLCLYVSAACAIDCTPTKGNEYCSCTGKNFSIDLSKILELPLKDIPELVGVQLYTYMFSPCEPVACVTGQTANGLVCQYDRPPASDAWFLGRNTVPPIWSVIQLQPNLAFSVTYSGGDKIVGEDIRERQAVFTFQYGSQPQLEIAMFGETNPDVYRRYTFVGSSSSILAEKRGGGGGTEVGVVGLILIILFIVAVVTYFFIGAIVNYHYRGARGAEVIPNYAMWKDLPFLVKDGFLFMISPCYKKGNYQKM